MSLEGAADLGEYFTGMGHATFAQANLAAGDIPAAHDASEVVWRCYGIAQPELAVAQSVFNSAEVALARGDFVVARELADAAVAVATGWQLVAALLVRARVAIAEGDAGRGRT